MIANALTLARLVAAPLVALGPLVVSVEATLGLFLAAAATDALDGWAARRLGQESRFGRALDPLADKALAAGGMVAAMLGRPELTLAVGPALALFLLRDLVVSALRASGRLAAAPSRLAKAKTTLLLAALALLLAAPVAAPAAFADALRGVGLAAMWLALALALVTALAYLRAVDTAEAARR